MSLLSYLKDKVDDLKEAISDDGREPASSVMDAVEEDVDSDLHGIRGKIMEFADGLKQWAKENPRTTFAILRKIKPILHLKSKNSNDSSSSSSASGSTTATTSSRATTRIRSSAPTWDTARW